MHYFFLVWLFVGKLVESHVLGEVWLSGEIPPRRERGLEVYSIQ